MPISVSTRWKPSTESAKALDSIGWVLSSSRKFWTKTLLKAEEIPSNARVAVDANVLIYHFTGMSQQCRAFLSRCQAREISVFCPAHIALEALHRLMMVEAVSSGVVGTSPTRKLSQAPERVKGLRSSYVHFELLSAFGIEILSLSARAVARVPWWSMQYGLLANDAGLLAAMEDHNLTHLVTADRQFLGVASIRTWLIDDLT